MHAIFNIDEFAVNNDVVSGFSNDNEAGTGEKLLFLLDRMEVINILMIVVIWNTSKNKFGNDLNRLIVNKSKELLNLLHEKVIEAEQNKNTQLQEWQSQKDEFKKVLIPNKAEINADFNTNDENELKEVNSLMRVDTEINFLSAVEDAESALRMLNKSDIEKMVNIANPNQSEECIMKSIILLKKGH